MTLNEWEQNNIEVLTSREMGEWLSRRENRLLEQIRAEIADLDDADYDYEGYYKAVTDALNIIDKYRKDG